MSSALVRRFPALERHLPRLPLGRLPTPVEPLELSPDGAFRGEVWVKRDDLSHDRYGGNKVRKLEFLLAEARRAGAGRLITVGAAGSHHALATTVHGADAGFAVTLVLFPQPMTPHVRRIVLQAHALGADIRCTSRMETVPPALLAARLALRRERPFVIAPGGSDPLGTLGYVDGALELADQIEAGLAPRPDAVHVAAGTLGTAAGLALGFALAGIECHIVATRITGRIVCNDRVLARLVAGAARILRRAGVTVPPIREAIRLVTVRHDQIGAGYGHETAAARDATARLESVGLALDPTYTAKSAAALFASIGDEQAGVHLFWHTLSAAEPVDVDEAANLDALPDPVRRLLAAD